MLAFARVEMSDVESTCATLGFFNFIARGNLLRPMTHLCLARRPFYTVRGDFELRQVGGFRYAM